MKLRNKGYTLVELILSIAIFAIVMVGIASIMTNTLKSYSKANIDISVQEDCQIAANQIEEFLCDANSLSAYTGDPAVGWTFNDGSSKTISYDGSKVMLTKGAETYTIADHVTSFSLENWKIASEVTSSNELAYNQVVVNMTMNNNGTTYSLKRDVYFRNDVENPTFHGISNLMGEAGGSGGGGVAGALNLNVKRYQTYNLTSEFRLRYDAKLYKLESGSWSVVSDPSTGTYDNSYFQLIKSNDSPTLTDAYADASTYYIKTGASLDADFDLTSYGKYKVVGNREDGSGQIEIMLNVDDVKILSDGVVIQHHNSDSVNGEGFTTPINVQGININDALNAGSTTFSMKAKYKIVTAANVEKAGFTDYQELHGCTTGVVKADETTCGTAVQPKNADTTPFGLFPDPYLGGLSVLGRNDKLKDSDSGKFLKNQNDLYFVFSFDIKSRGVTQSVPDAKIKFNALGKNF